MRASSSSCCCCVGGGEPPSCARTTASRGRRTAGFQWAAGTLRQGRACSRDLLLSSVAGGGTGGGTGSHQLADSTRTGGQPPAAWCRCGEAATGQRRPVAEQKGHVCWGSLLPACLNPPPAVDSQPAVLLNTQAYNALHWVGVPCKAPAHWLETMPQLCLELDKHLATCRPSHAVAQQAPRCSGHGAGSGRGAPAGPQPALQALLRWPQMLRRQCTSGSRRRTAGSKPCGGCPAITASSAMTATAKLLLVLPSVTKCYSLTRPLRCDAAP